jgi:hypothetical protein
MMGMKRKVLQRAQPATFAAASEAFWAKAAAADSRNPEQRMAGRRMTGRGTLRAGFLIGNSLGNWAPGEESI